MTNENPVHESGRDFYFLIIDDFLSELTLFQESKYYLTIFQISFIAFKFKKCYNPTKKKGVFFMLSDNIRKYRKLNHMSQDELAEKLDVTRQSISLWETGQTQPSLDNIVALTKLFDVSTDDLLGEDEPELVCTDSSDLTNGKPLKRKIPILIIICFVLILALVAAVLLWKIGIFGNKNSASTSSATSQSTSSLNTLSIGYSLIDNESFNKNNNSSLNLIQSNNKTNSKNQTSQNSSSKNNSKSSSKNSASNDNVNENIDNGVLEKVSTENMSVPENMKLLGSNSADEENNASNIKATAAVYQLDGNVVNWTTEKDLIYVITSGNNRLVVIDSNTMMPVSNTPLSGVPAEINLIGDEIYISLPDLCRIDVFSKSKLTKKSSLNFEHEVSSFCIDGKYIYYSEHSQHCAVYKKNLNTNQLTKIIPDRGYTFYQPKLYLNKQDNILYIGESGLTGSSLFYYDATTLQLKSMFRKNDYGIMNHTREIFHIGNEIFWGNYRFSDTQAQIVGRYGKADYGSVNFASKEIVSTFEGLFLTDTYECIINYFDAGFEFEYILVTESNNIFFRAKSVDKNIIIGVNFTLQ